jgi:oligopeptide/dipeptide ABC transporter ATP-binding protein
MALLLITHDLAVVSEIADEVAVMYAGRIVERGPTRRVLERPLHPYTRGLVRSIPSRAVREGATDRERLKLRLPTIPGTVPALGRWPAGCRFADRCERVEGRCRERSPALVAHGHGGEVACFRADEPFAETTSEAGT